MEQQFLVHYRQEYMENFEVKRCTEQNFKEQESIL